ncbi:hypothetical protein IEN85_15600 [Pelagicoccus sp. NFK12]|uniref:TonB-dependent receptor plug domain-containing protein n=1 Tax=Pelagicoccus enzymogenes TaxID=2773457 RepID=A0A927F9R4_9BACT|nr:TonB-dependent receptor plug domain-containing protein [Pelagicoccus enzymogenes]MBD5780924.1 hypothetical protein [Pelagicoccus enzymogenes]MDQ8199962.1 hypothetical protein [Pelagicoccus enzymogenes]
MPLSHCKYPAQSRSARQLVASTPALALLFLPLFSEAQELGGSDEEVFELSPFEVVAEATGYFQSNSMSGTRLNSKVEDLAQSITVMTTEQMQDFAMVDINDVFDHMAGTEGTSSYSLFETDRTGAVVDQVSLDPNNANRVRGIGNANIAFNNIGMTGYVPVDPLWLDSLELSRGPNANIFGLGNAAGTVNQVPATANLNHEFTKVDLRVDSYDGHRASIDVNRMLSDELAVRFSVAKQHTGFVRKPSGEDARRLSLQVKARPWENTTLAASWYKYDNESVRPNYTTPRDYYSSWVADGKPMWNTVTGLVTMGNGDVYGRGNVLGSTTPYTSRPSYFDGEESRSPFKISPNLDPYWTMGRLTRADRPFYNTDPYAAATTGVGMLRTKSTLQYSASQQPLYNSLVPPVSDKSIYDWEEVNLMGNSKAWDDTNIYMAQIDQLFLNSTKHTLAFQGTFMREDVVRNENQPMGRASVNSNVGQIQVDVNQVNLDGSPNPYAGLPYLRAEAPYRRDYTKLWDTTRAQGVYRVNFADDDGWTKWLGTQQVLGYYEYKDRQNRIYTYRNSPLNQNVDWIKKYYDLNIPLANRTTSNVDPIYGDAPSNYHMLNEFYYVGDTPGGGIEYAPSYFPTGVSAAYVWGHDPNNLRYDVSSIGFTPSPDGTAGQHNVQNVIKTDGFVLQSTLFDGKLVGTFGKRSDTVYDRNAPFATLTPDLLEYDFALTNRWNEGWREASGKSENLSIVARPFRDLDFLKSKVDGGSGISKLFAEALSGLSLTYNEADNFIAQGPAWDLDLNPLPNQTGTTTDKGFWMSMMEGRLSLRYVHYETKQSDLRQGDISTMAQRIMRMDGFVSNDSQALNRLVRNLQGREGGDTAGDDPAVMAPIMGLDVDYYTRLQQIADDNTYAAVNDMVSRGDELEINFNPNKFWTVSASVTKNEAINTAAGQTVDDYIANRMPVWTSFEDPRFYHDTVTIDGVEQLRTFWKPVDRLLTTDVDESAVDPIMLEGDYSHIPEGPGGNLLWWYIAGDEFNDGLGPYHNDQTPEARFISNVDSPLSVFRALVGRPRPQIRKYSAKFNTKYNLAGISEGSFLKHTSVGASVRWIDKANIGFYGMGYDPNKDLTLPENKITTLDTNRPIYSPAETFVDLFVTYKTKLFDDKVAATFQLNVKNAFENGGGLQATQAYLDGTVATYRIIDPRQFILSASFDM